MIGLASGNSLARVPDARPSGRLPAAWLIAALLYAAYAVLFTWPLARHPLSMVPAPGGGESAYLSLWSLGWDLSTLSRSPAALVTGGIFDANVFYPATHALAYTDHLLLQALLAWPVHAATGSLAAAYNAALVGSLVAAAMAMFAFARAISGSDKAALVAGLCWGFWPYHAAHLPDLARHALVFLPLALLALHRLVAGRRLRDALLLGVAVGAQALSSTFYVVVTVVAITAASAALLFAVGRWRNTPSLVRLALSAIVAAALVVPMSWPYAQVLAGGATTSPSGSEGEQVPRVASYGTAPASSALYGEAGWLRLPHPGSPGAGQVQFTGFAVAAAALLALWPLRGRRRSAATWPLSALVVAGFVLSVEPVIAQRAGGALGDAVFGSRASRSPEVFGVLVALGISGLAALGVARFVVGRGLWAMALIVAGVEYANAPIAVVGAPPSRSDIGAWLKERPGAGPVVYLPLDLDDRNALVMIESLQHGRPILNGVGFWTPGIYPVVADALKTFPGADAMWALKRTGVRYLVVPHAVDVPAPGPLVERAAFGDTRIYELVWNAEAPHEVKRPELPPPPKPVPSSLPIGEVATYEVGWAAGGMDLPAGDVRVSIGAGGDASAPGSAYRFDVMVSTAAWVSRYYDAQDRFTSWTDAGLMPLTYEEHLREGGRVLRVAARFDPASRLVTVERSGAEGEGPVAPFALAPAARDPVSAFFYARTRPLAPRDRVRIPINHLGQGLRVDLTAGAVESVKVGSRHEDALRIDLRIEYEAELREAPRVSLWQSRDERRIPLIVEIDAGFGLLRATLIEYERGLVKPRPGGE
jgi:hypothetical protein